MEIFKRIRQEELPEFLAKIIPYACFVLVIGALIITTALGRSDLAAMGLYMVIPVTLIVVIVIWKPNLVKNITDFATPSHRYLYFLPHVFAILYFISLSLIIGNESRPLAYFILVAIMAGLIAMQITTVESKNGLRNKIILAQIILLSLNVIFGQTLKLPLFWGDIDSIAHLRWIELGTNYGYIPPEMGPYSQFPFMHVYYTIGTVVSGMDPKISSFILQGLSFAMSIGLVYLLVGLLTKSPQIPLFSALIYSINRDVLLDAMPLLPRTMAFFFCLLVLYLLLKGKNNIQLTIMAVFLIIPLNLTHNVTLAYMTCIMVGIIVIDLFLHRRVTYIRYTYVMLFTVVYIAYWMFIATHHFTTIALILFQTNLPVAIPSQTSVIRAYAEPAFYVYLIKYSDYIVLVFLAILGIISQLSLGKKGNKLGNIFALFSLPALFFYLPSPAAFLYLLLLTSRLALVLSPFIVFVAARGLSLFFNQQWSLNAQRWKKIALPALGFFAIIVYTFFSVTILASWTDFNLTKLEGSKNRHYFTQAEINTFSFMGEHIGKAPVYSDYLSTYYLKRWVGIMNVRNNIFAVGSTETGEEYFFLLREEELRSKGVLLFTSPPEKGFMGTLYHYRPEVDPSPEPTWEEEHKIYDNKDVVIYYSPQQ